MPLPGGELAAGSAAVCTLCGASNQVRLYPSALADQAPIRTESAVEGEATCFDHPSKRAVAACSQCGRFVCQLCSVEFANQVWCPSCVAAGLGKARPAKAETSRTLYDSLALMIPVGGLILYPFMVLTAPASLVMTVLKWKQPLSLVRRNRWRFIVAILLSLAELGLCATVVYFLVRGPFRGIK
jgi:hypothetical protein